MSREYPYLLAGLPELSFDGEAKGFSFDEWVAALRERLAGDDRQLLRLLLMGLPAGAPTAVFYAKAARSRNHFIRHYFAFDRDFRNILSGMAARRLHSTPEHPVPEMAGWLVGDGAVTEAICTSRAADFGLGASVDFMPALSSILETDNLMERERKLDGLRWSRAEALTVFHYLDTDRVLSLVVKAHITARWQRLDPQKGEAFFKQLVADLKGNYTT